jgi:hypothetical protein
MRVQQGGLPMGFVLSAALALLPTGCGGSKSFTPADFQKVTVGMTEKQVTDLLGKPAETMEAVGVKRSFWKVGESYYSVSFADGKAQEPIGPTGKEEQEMLKALMQAARGMGNSDQGKAAGQGPFVEFNIEPAELAGAKVGDTIKVVGEYGSARSDGTVSLMFARRYYGFRPSTSAPALLQEHTKDPAAAQKKYNQKSIVVEGVLASLDPQKTLLSGSAPPGSPVAPPGPRPDLSKAKPDFSLTAEAFAKEVNKDREAARKKYGGKVIDVSGVVGALMQYSKAPALMFAVDRAPLTGVVFLADVEPWATVSPGQEVKLRGRLPREELDQSLLRDCTVIDKGPNPAATITAEQLAQECAVSPEAANKKYKDKHLYITGEVTALKEGGQDGSLEIQLKGHDEVPVKLWLNSTSRSEADEVQVGMKVKALASYSFANKNEVRLSGPLFVYGPE